VLKALDLEVTVRDHDVVVNGQTWARADASSPRDYVTELVHSKRRATLTVFQSTDSPTDHGASGMYAELEHDGDTVTCVDVWWLEGTVRK
jgi:hypothetical protein